MSDRDFETEGILSRIVDKASQMIILSFLWIIGSLPLITIGTSTAALYYATVKAARVGEAEPASAFWESYKCNLWRGIWVTIAAVLLGGLFCLNLKIMSGSGKTLFSSAAVIGLAVLICCCVYLFPVISRFRVSFADTWKLSFVMAFRFFHLTALIILGFIAVCLLQFYILPIPTMLILPGVWCFISTFLVEKVLRAYMPEQQEGDTAWYYET